MIPALFTSSSALNANQTMLSVVGNNLANSNTTGYKSQTLLFSNQFSQLLSGASQPTATSGGRNPVQIGMGVQVSATDTNLTQGTFQNTGNPFDLAINNNGYFVLKNGPDNVYTRAGSFNVDSNGTLVDPATGAKVQRIGTVGEGTATTPAFQTSGDSDIIIPKGLTIPGVATQNITFQGNLNASALPPTAQVLVAGQAFTAAGIPATLTTSLDALDQTSFGAGSPTGYLAGDTIAITGTRVDGTTVNAVYTCTGTPANDTVGALINSINQAFLSGTSVTGATAALDSTGHITLTANGTGPSSATLNLTSTSPNASGASTQFSNFIQTVPGASGSAATSVVQIYDAQGTPHNITFSFVKVADNQWNVVASMNPADGTISGPGEDNTVAGISFNQDGSLQSISGNSQAQVEVTKNPMTIGGAAATLTTPLEGLDQHTPAATPYGATDNIIISGTDFSGNTIVPVSMPTTIAGNPATVGDLINTINTAFGGAVASLDSSGNIEFSAKHSGQTALSIKIVDDQRTPAARSTDFSKFIVAKPGTNGDNNITFQINTLASFGKPQTVTLQLGTPNGVSGITQTGGTTSVNASKQDGYAQGTLESTSVGADGVIIGQFTNGQAESIAQIALATFNNPGGLQNAGNNYLMYSTASGLPQISAPQSGGAGSLQSGGLEGSNVDVGTEFTLLIAAQRGYEVNAKAFSIANQVMQASLDLLR